MSNNRDDQQAAVAGRGAQAFTEGSIDSHFIMASLEAFNAEIAVHLQAEKVSAGEPKAKLVKSQGSISAPTASIAGDITSSNARVSGDVTRGPGARPQRRRRERPCQADHRRPAAGHRR